MSAIGTAGATGVPHATGGAAVGAIGALHAIGVLAVEAGGGATAGAICMLQAWLLFVLSAHLKLIAAAGTIGALTLCEGWLGPLAQINK